VSILIVSVWARVEQKQKVKARVKIIFTWRVD